MFTAVAVALAALIVGLSAARELRGAPLIAAVAIGLSLVTENLLARPHVLALPLAAAWGAGIIAARDRGRAPPLWLAALMLVWANMHGGYIFGLVLMGPFALEAVIEAPTERVGRCARVGHVRSRRARGRAPQSLWDGRALPSISPDVGREFVAHQ